MISRVCIMAASGVQNDGGLSNLWTPQEIDLSMWLDSNDEGSIGIGNYPQILIWGDNSGNIMDCTLYSTSNYPSPKIYNHGVSCTSSTGDAFYTDPGSMPVLHSIFAVRTGVHGGIFSRGPSDVRSDNTFYIAGYSGSPSTIEVSINHESGNTCTATCENMYESSSEDPYILSSIYDGGSSCLVHQNGNELSLNQITTSSGNGNSGSGVTTYVCGRFFQNYSNIYSLSKELHELIYTTSVVSPETRQIIEGYLAHKWDGILGVTKLCDSLPSGHPYKDLPPTI